MVSKKKIKSAAAGRGWNLWEDGVTQGFIGLWLTCRVQTVKRYVERWTPHTPSIAFTYGGLVHHVLEHTAWTRPEPARVTELIQAWGQRWLAEHHLSSPRDRTMLGKAMGLAAIVLPQYFKMWPDDLQRNWVEVESTFRIPYVYPDGKTTYIRGRLDGAFLKKRELFLFETKTASIIDEQKVSEVLELLTQVQLYLLALEQTYGQRAAGVLYNFIRRPILHEHKGEADEKFYERVTKDVLSQKRADHYFKRFEAKIGFDTQAAWRANFLHPVMAEIRAWAEGERPTLLNPDALITKYGPCPFFDAIVHGDHSSLFQRTTIYSELEEE